MLFDSIKNPLLLSFLYEQAAESILDKELAIQREHEETRHLISEEAKAIEKLPNLKSMLKMHKHMMERDATIPSSRDNLKKVQECLHMARQLISRR
jgi:hypothetical protein